MARRCSDSQEGHVVVVFSRLLLLRTMHIMYLVGAKRDSCHKVLNFLTMDLYVKKMCDEVMNGFTNVGSDCNYGKGVQPS